MVPHVKRIPRFSCQLPSRLIDEFYYFHRNDLPVYKEMKFLSEVKRFGMAVMFLSEKDKKGGLGKVSSSTKHAILVLWRVLGREFDARDFPSPHVSRASCLNPQ